VAASSRLDWKNVRSLLAGKRAGKQFHLAWKTKVVGLNKRSTCNIVPGKNSALSKETATTVLGMK
jgi:hypothetical protein